MIAKSGVLFFVAFFLLTALAWPQDAAEEIPVLEAGERFVVSEGIYGTWEFTQKPQIGMVILKVQLFDKNDVKISPLTISGRSDMPSMRGHHDSGVIAFKLNKAQNYLLPVNVVMPGDWEIELVFRAGERVVFRGTIRFDV